MYLDGYQITAPVFNPVSTTAEIGTVFNSITYNKGASLLRMLESAVGDENFKQGLNVIHSIANIIFLLVLTAQYNTHYPNTKYIINYRIS